VVDFHWQSRCFEYVSVTDTINCKDTRPVDQKAQLPQRDRMTHYVTKFMLVSKLTFKGIGNGTI